MTFFLKSIEEMENKARKSPVNQNQKIQRYTIGKR